MSPRQFVFHSRGRLAGILALALGWQAAAAQTLAPQATITLWPGNPPETQQSPTSLVVEERGDPAGVRDRSAYGITEPTLDLFPAAEPNGQALLILPGGGYQRVVFDKEGYEVADWFNRRGISAYVLTYRLPGEGWTHRADVPLEDAQRALRWIRAHAHDFGLREDAIGVMGFSAGGHLAGMLATGYDRKVYDDRDAVDAVSARPDFAVLVYPVVSMRADITHAGSRQSLLGPAPDDAAVAANSVESNVGPGTPPVLLVHATDDPAVPVANSLELYRALTAAGVPAEMHVFEVGGHGFGLRSPADRPVAIWPELVARWLAGLE